MHIMCYIYLKLLDMKKILSGFAVSLLVLFVLTGCSDEPGTLLTDGVWHFANVSTDSQDNNVQQLVAWYKALLTDATLEFQSGGTYLITSPLMEEPESGTWSLVGEDQLILHPTDGSTSTANIEELTKKKLSYIETYIDQSQNSYSLTTSWKRD
jgi:hypothetical protein